MQTSLKAKLLRNLGANAYGQLVTIAIQLVSVPLYLYYWGVELYGEWLILSAIPAYLALSDIGFASVAANDMTMRVAKGDKKGALEVYQSTWLFVSAVSAMVGCTLGAILYAVPVPAMFSFSHISATQTQQALIILMLYVLIGLQSGVLNAALRATGRYAYSTVMGNTVRLTEWVVSMLALMMGGDVIVISTATLATRLIGFWLLWKALRYQEKWLPLGYKSATTKQVRNLTKPAIAFMAFPLGLALSLQGMVLIIGITLGSTAVVIFSAYRTLTRLLVQVITMLNQAVWPEISAAYGAENIELVKKLYHRNSLLTFWIALGAVSLIGVTGEFIIGVWTHHSFSHNSILLTLLLVSTFFNVLWQASWVVLMATNKHQKIAVIFLICTSLSLLFSYIGSPHYGLYTVGVALIIFELPLLYKVIDITLHFLKISWSDYVKSVFTFKNNKAPKL